jgi:tetratricopeptide (TPR) repeat protein
MRKSVLFILFLFCFAAVSAQEEKKEEKDKALPEGNDAFAKKDYTEAEANYRISQSKFPKKAIASYNLGNSIYAMKQTSEAKFAYTKAIKNATTHPEKHQAFHNLGNTLMKQKDYQGAVAAYKNALINDPADEETRYNYALAKKMLKENPPKNDKDKKDKKDDKKDKNKNKKDDKDKKDNKDKKDDKKDNKDNKDKKDDKGDQKKDKGGDKPDQQNPPQPKPGGISNQRMQNMLDAVNNEEKKVQDKVKARQVKGQPVQTEKDW